MVNSPLFCDGSAEELDPVSELNGELAVDGALLMGLIGVVVVGRWVVVVVIVALVVVVVVGLGVVVDLRVDVLFLVVSVTGPLVVVRVGYPLVGVWS